jgi:hypothetical protein
MLAISGSESSIEVGELAEYPPHGGSQGFKSPHLHPQKPQVRASPVLHERRSPAVWDHFWTTRAPIQGQDLALGGVGVHGVEAVAQLPVVALEQAAVAVEGE